jgi:hypothetical protein
LEGSYSEPEIKSALAVIQSWIEAIGTKTLARRLQAELDAEFTEDVIERLLVDQHSDGQRPQVTGEVTRRLSKVVERVGGAVSLINTSSNDSRPWVGSVYEAYPRSSFMKWVKSLVEDSQVGRALVLNLVRTEDEVRAIVGSDTNVAVLIEDDAKVLGSDVVSLVKKKPEENGEIGQSARKQDQDLVKMILVMIALLFIVVLIMVGVKKMGEGTPPTKLKPVPRANDQGASVKPEAGRGGRGVEQPIDQPTASRPKHEAANETQSRP